MAKCSRSCAKGVSWSGSVTFQTGFWCRIMQVIVGKDSAHREIGRIDESQQNDPITHRQLVPVVVLLTAGILMLARDSQLREQISRNARTTILQSYSNSVMCSRYLDVYEDACHYNRK